MLELRVDPDAPVGTILTSELGSIAIVVIRHADGWAAIPNQCPHAGCRLDRKGQVVDGTVLVCNCHGAEFDLRSGDVLLDPAESSPLDLLDLTVSADGTSVSVTGSA